MQQQLYLEPAWGRTISDQDRQRIEKLVAAQEQRHDAGLEYTYIRHATNHRGELLYTILLHNYGEDASVFHDKKVTLSDAAGAYLSETFTLPVEIPPHSSMPWTFIFSGEAAGKMNIKDSALQL